MKNLKQTGNRPEDAIAASCHNLIILDESGSMHPFVYDTILGCNQTLATIHSTQHTDPHTRQFVSIYCFSTNLNDSRYIIENAPVDTVKNISPTHYRPGGLTALNDAIGYTCERLYRSIKDDKNATAVVTIITDGGENSSTDYSLERVKALIERLKELGWVFSFIGANIDAEATSRSYSIDSSFQFEQTTEGFQEMWEAERNSRYRHQERLCRIRKADYDSEEERRHAMAMLNEGYFREFNRVTPEIVTTLRRNEVFVFGSSINGAHSGGAARVAVKRFGAIMGKGEGPQGQSYAIPTTGVSSQAIKHYVSEFVCYADKHAELNFFVTPIGCGVAGYTDEQIAPLFAPCASLSNVALPQSFWAVLQKMGIFM